VEVTLRQLTIGLGAQEYAMLQEIGASEHGFTNEVSGMSYAEYRAWLTQQDDWSRGESMPESWIPQTTYFLYVNDEPVGIARIRHTSSEALEAQGVGNFGYGIARPYRGKGYGHLLFREVLKKCRQLGYTKIKSFVHIGNAASNRIFQQNGARHIGVFHDEKNIYETDV